MSSADIIEYVMSCTSEKELSSLNSLLFSRMKGLQATRDYAMVSTLRIGDQVSFDRGPRRGGICHGTVTKLGPKNVHIKVHGISWRVNAGALTKI